MAADELRVQIRNAFLGVTLGNGISASQSDWINQFGMAGPRISAEEYARLSDPDEKNDWSRITFESPYDSMLLTHMDAAGFRFHLPAYLMLILDTNDTYGGDLMTIHVLQSLCPVVDDKSMESFRMAKFELLDNEQRRVIQNFLTWVLQSFLAEDDDWRPEIERSLRDFWARWAD